MSGKHSPRHRVSAHTAAGVFVHQRGEVGTIASVRPRVVSPRRPPPRPLQRPRSPADDERTPKLTTESQRTQRKSQRRWNYYKLAGWPGDCNWSFSLLCFSVFSVTLWLVLFVEPKENGNHVRHHGRPGRLCLRRGSRRRLAAQPRLSFTGAAAPSRGARKWKRWRDACKRRPIPITGRRPICSVRCCCRMVAVSSPWRATVLPITRPASAVAGWSSSASSLPRTWTLARPCRSITGFRSAARPWTICTNWAAISRWRTSSPRSLPPPNADPIPVLPVRLWQEGALLFAASTPSDPDHRLRLLEQAAGTSWQWLPLVGPDFPLQTYAQRGPLIAWTPHLTGVALKLDHKSAETPIVRPVRSGRGPRLVIAGLLLLLFGLLAANCVVPACAANGDGGERVVVADGTRTSFVFSISKEISDAERGVRTRSLRRRAARNNHGTGWEPGVGGGEGPLAGTL